MDKKLAIGVDIGGSHVSCVAYNLESKTLLKKTHAENDLDNHGQPDEIINTWGRTIRKTMELAGFDKVSGIGFAMPGPFDYVKGIPLFTGENGKYENIYGVNVPDLLKNYLELPGDFKIRFINDATAFAIGEDQVGKASDCSQSLSVTLGTGFGSAFIRNELPVVDGDEVPENGCLWHLPFENGIADDYFSTRGLISRFEMLAGEKLSGVKQLAELAGKNKIAQDLFDDFGIKMGMFLHPWIEKFGIEVFVIGGNISRAYHLFGNSLNKYLEKRGLKMEISVSELKEAAAFIGAATLVDNNFYKRIIPALSKM
ncbi:ROK family protein [uncultured Draconibacterium sp.]|mgnify:CR=1 FL=1|uniref:ROK family protein n=1 Tax=uncultured Draconibacterium sp. TaxID=1573823 RepID=UPI0025E476CC|nr:ROK family protein [uncultured Draconibacterium sp.]